MTNQQGGIFEVIDIDMATTFTSSVEANEFNVKNESAIIEGRLNAPYITNKGILEITSTLETNDLTNEQHAQLKVDDNVVAGTINNAGIMELGSHLKAEDIQSTGQLTSAGAVEGTTITLEGKLNIKEIRAEKMDITVTDNSTVDYLTANYISVKAKREALIFKDKDHTLKVEEVDGGTVYVENVIAQLIRGDEVTIGPNCTIKVVEYTGNYTLDDQSDVLELGKITRD